MPLIIKILYGSETGNAQDFAEQIWQNLYSKNILTQCLAMDDYSINVCFFYLFLGIRFWGSLQALGNVSVVQAIFLKGFPTFNKTH